MRRKAKAIPAAKDFAEARTRPGYTAAYDALEEEFSLVADQGPHIGRADQAEVARRVNTTEPAIAKLEAGEQSPSTRTRERFAKATGPRLKISSVPERDRASRQQR